MPEDPTRATNSPAFIFRERFLKTWSTPFLYLKLTSLNSTLPLNMRQFNGIGRVLDIWLYLQNFHDPLKARHSLLIESGEIAVSPNGFDEDAHIQ